MITEIELRARLAENLKRIRKEASLTQFELAEKADTSEMTVKKIETGRQWPSEKTLAQIANALNIDVYNLFLPEKISAKTEKEIRNKIFSNLLEDFKGIVKDAAQNIKL